MKWFLLNFLFLFCSSVAWSQSGPASFLPDREEIPGWRPAEDASVFRKESLDKVAGEETDLILEYGFNYAATRKYYNFHNRIIRVVVLTMDNSFGSYGLFLRQSRKDKVFREFGNPCYERAGEFGFWKQFYFIRMYSDVSNDTVSEGYRQIASYIDSKIKSRGMLPEILKLSGNDGGKVRIFNGPLALSEIYYFSPLNIFFVKEGIAIEKGDSTSIILRYSDNNEAVRRYSEVAGMLGSMPKFSNFLTDSDFSFHLKDHDGKTLIFKVEESNLEITIKK